MVLIFESVNAKASVTIQMDTTKYYCDTVFNALQGDPFQPTSRLDKILKCAH